MAAAAEVNRFVTVKHYIDGVPSESDFEIKCGAPLTALLQRADQGSGLVIVKNLYVSVDPYQLNRAKMLRFHQSGLDFMERLVPGEAIGNALGVGVVVASGDPEFERDDAVVGFLGWEEYTAVRPAGRATMLKKIQTREFPLSYHLSVLGASGFTAYAGFYDVCRPKGGEKVLVSSAAGSIGNVVGQLAKLSGCYVVGSAGSKTKVDLLKEKLGFHDAFNYKEEPDLKLALKRCFPDGIDIYFDNVGGEMLEAAVSNMRDGGRIAACGVISEYTGEGRRAAPDMLDVIYKRIAIRGFYVFDHMHLYPDFLAATSDHLRHGRMHALEDISEGLESAPSALVGLFRGDNVGKKLIKVRCDDGDGDGGDI